MANGASTGSLTLNIAGLPGRSERVGVGRTQGPLADALRGAGEYTIARALIEGLLDGSYFAPDPLVEGIELQIADAIIEVIAAADLCGPFIVNAG